MPQYAVAFCVIIEVVQMVKTQPYRTSCRLDGRPIVHQTHHANVALHPLTVGDRQLALIYRKTADIGT